MFAMFFVTQCSFYARKQLDCFSAS